MSKTTIKSYNFSLYAFMKQHKKTMSFENFNGRTKRLEFIGRELEALKFEINHVKRFKEKHITALVSGWQERNLSIGRIKNLMSDLRFVCREFNRSDVVKKNDDYAIGTRSYIPTKNKAIVNADFSTITDPHLKISLALQAAFGLRREECIKIIPALADKNDHLWLKGSWTKGKVERCIPIQNQAQRRALDQAKDFAKNNSLIPANKTYIQQRNIYNNETKGAGFKNLHGLRHAYAQQRYLALTGWHAPIAGGKKRIELNPYEKKIDKRARGIISNELGHSRVAITNVYLG